MREPNVCFPGQSRAAVCITSALYDRRALDCTATLPIINSLTHLAYLTSTSPRIRDILVVDAGLERLIHILSSQQQPTDLRSLWKWSLAFQCVVNLGVRGTEHIRTRVVDAGAVPIVIQVLENFLKALDVVTRETQLQQQTRQRELQDRTSRRSGRMFSLNSDAAAAFADTLTPSSEQNHEESVTVFPRPLEIETLPSLTTPPTSDTTSTDTTRSSPSPITCTTTSSQSREPKSDIISHNELPPSSASRPYPAPPTTIRRSTFPYVKIRRERRRQNRVHGDTRNGPLNSSSQPSAADARAPLNIDSVFYREEDILMSLQLLAYLSKYPHIRHLFHVGYDCNVFSVVQKFTYKVHSSAIQYWAGVIMRNACRKDETRGGIRRCANMQCLKWEQKPREFAKCRRCRKAKYCSKACQSKAWSDGHRWWCVERLPTTVPLAQGEDQQQQQQQQQPHQHQHQHPQQQQQQQPPQAQTMHP